MNASDSAKHTPGPWQVSQDDCPWTCGDAQTAIEHGEELGHTEILFTLHAGDEAEPIAHLVWEPLSDKARQAELRANAQLIASAPELLEFAALVARMRTLEEFGDGDDAPEQDDWIETLGELIASARTIVAKAQGEVTP